MGELDELRECYDSGKLDPLKDDLVKFIVSHREAIKAFREENTLLSGAPMPEDLAIKLFILKNRTVNPQRDIADQVREIERERWIVGEKNRCAPDPQSVADEWAKKHSHGWRDHRVLTIVYVFEREKDRYVDVLHRQTP